jgi:hypothetical protein
MAAPEGLEPPTLSPIGADALAKKYYAFPAKELVWFLRSMGEQLTPEDKREYLKQFPLDQVPASLLQLWRDAGFV